tara:strand:+ start:1979 stop:2239 length:261 start_codon:yes stop_codon:yes gene_type:complete
VKRTLLAATLAFPLSLSSAHANDQDDALAMAEDAMARLMLALELMIAAIPQYEMPEVLENGDIIIRRVRPAVEGDTNDDGIPEEET